MATYRHGHEENPKCVIRDQLALDPITTIPRLTEAISRRLNHSFDLRYIKRLRDKVVARTLIEIDRIQIEERMNFTRQNY